MKNKQVQWEMCKCKKFSGYSLGYICLSCHKHIYTEEQGKEVDQLRGLGDKYPQGWTMRGDDKELYILIEKQWWQVKEDAVFDIKFLLSSQLEEVEEWAKKNEYSEGGFSGSTIETSDLLLKIQEMKKEI